MERCHVYMDAQQLAISMWALAKLEAATPETFQSAMRQLTRRHIASMCGQDMSNVLWAVAKSCCLPDPALQVRDRDVR